MIVGYVHILWIWKPPDSCKFSQRQWWLCPYQNRRQNLWKKWLHRTKKVCVRCLSLFKKWQSKQYEGGELSNHSTPFPWRTSFSFIYLHLQHRESWGTYWGLTKINNIIIISSITLPTINEGPTCMKHSPWFHLIPKKSDKKLRHQRHGKGGRWGSHS